ncbi:hypothetical protein C5167_036535 [Papaver somniferum]|uniref:Reverse transcriptase zinc-binding domain-containing protein n=1 Tax=Papaver somniferum TaxID=3469 RepID=A0A4Y7I6Y2_PAPSO|nr:hypothetical protein C5167_036535 [Papaver somniferum]
MAYTFSQSGIFRGSARGCTGCNLGEEEFYHTRTPMACFIHPKIISNIPDRRVWLHSATGEFSAKSCYNVQIEEAYQEEIHFTNPHILWNDIIPTKVSFFIWATLWNASPTMDVLVRRAVVPPTTDIRCKLCLMEEETISHILLHCSFVYEVWSYFLRYTGMNTAMPFTTGMCIDGWTRKWPNVRHNFIWNCLPHAIWWAVWLERNRRFFHNKSQNEADTIIAVKALIWWLGGRKSFIRSDWDGIKLVYVLFVRMNSPKMMLECDLDPTADTTQHSVTAKYVNFLLATASGNLDMIAAHVLSAITPCVRVSATLAKLIKPVTRRNKRPRRFNMWIDRYSSDEFEASTVQTEELLDWLSNSLTDEERKVLGKVYHQAMKLEVEFFYSRLAVPTKLIPVSLLHNHEEERLLLFSVFDFACTATAVDSLQGLEQMTLSSAKEKSIVGLPPRPGRRPRPGNTHLQMSRADLQKAWDAIVVFDKRETDKWLLKILAIPIAVGFDYEGLCKVLEHLSVIRENRISRIIDTGVLKGLSLSRMQLAGTKMNLYYGCVNFFEKVFRNKALNASVHVISCWCEEDLMRSALPGESDKLKLNGNEFDYETGAVTRRMVLSPSAKFSYFNDAIQKYEREHGKPHADCLHWLLSGRLAMPSKR